MIGKRIKELRKSNHMTQEDLAVQLNKQFGLNIDRVMISKWETEFQTPVAYTISCLSKIFGVSMNYLLGEDEPEQPKITDEEIKFALFGGEVSDESYEEVKRFVEYIKNRDKMNE